MTIYYDDDFHFCDEYRKTTELPNGARGPLDSSSNCQFRESKNLLLVSVAEFC